MNNWIGAVELNTTKKQNQRVREIWSPSERDKDRVWRESIEDANILIISMVIYQTNCANFLLRPTGRNKPCRNVVKQLGILCWIRPPYLVRLILYLFAFFAWAGGLSEDLMSTFNEIINVSLSIIKAIEPGEENELDVLVQNP